MVYAGGMRIVDQVLAWFGGNHQRMADAAGVSRQAIYRWFMPDMGFVPNREPAIRLAEALAADGKVVTPAVLMGLEPMKATGTDGSPKGKGGRVRSHNATYDNRPAHLEIAEAVDGSAAAEAPGGDVRHGGAEMLVAQEKLDVPGTLTIMEQLRRDGVPKRLWPEAFTAHLRARRADRAANEGGMPGHAGMGRTKHPARARAAA
jgi:hypothetical protein